MNKIKTAGTILGLFLLLGGLVGTRYLVQQKNIGEIKTLAGCRCEVAGGDNSCPTGDKEEHIPNSGCEDTGWAVCCTAPAPTCFSPNCDSGGICYANGQCGATNPDYPGVIFCCVNGGWLPEGDPGDGDCTCNAGGFFIITKELSQSVASGDTVHVSVQGGPCSEGCGGEPCAGAAKGGSCTINSGEKSCPVGGLDCYCEPFTICATSDLFGSLGCDVVSGAVNGGSATVNNTYSPPPPPPPPPPTATPTPTPTPLPESSCVDLIPNVNLNTVQPGDTIHFTIQGENADDWRAEVNGVEILNSGNGNEFDYTVPAYGSYTFQAWIHGASGWDNGSQCSETIQLEAPELLCVDLIMDPADASDVGDEVSFTCIDSGTNDYGPDRFDFRYSIDAGGYNDIPWIASSLRFADYEGVDRWMADSQS
ncbi:hypothetical protein KKD62_01875, partial [Patescibacteria group bacterium]|nr:hypothetical protein [Patescibacteria group bacterium]